MHFEGLKNRNTVAGPPRRDRMDISMPADAFYGCTIMTAWSLDCWEPRQTRRIPNEIIIRRIPIIVDVPAHRALLGIEAADAFLENLPPRLNGVTEAIVLEKKVLWENSAAIENGLMAASRAEGHTSLRLPPGLHLPDNRVPPFKIAEVRLGVVARAKQVIDWAETENIEIDRIEARIAHPPDALAQPDARPWRAPSAGGWRL